MKERVVAVAVMALVGLVVLGLIRVQSPDPQENLRADRMRFFIAKTHAEPVYDLVIVGDSRALRGISPDILSDRMPGLRVFNFAFHAGGFNPEIFAAAEALLDPDSPRPTILVAPTPLGFMDWKQHNDQFREYRSKPLDQVFLYRDAYPLADFFRPIAPLAPLRALFGLEPRYRLTERFSPDGWIETDQEPYGHFTGLTLLREQLEGNRVDDSVIAGLMEQVRDWRQRGIAVFGTFVPAYGPRGALEDSMLGFDRSDFVAAFGRAGGTFILPQVAGMQTYDGSHLVSRSAREFSRALADSIAPPREGAGASGGRQAAD